MGNISFFQVKQTNIAKPTKRRSVLLPQKYGKPQKTAKNDDPLWSLKSTLLCRDDDANALNVQGEPVRPTTLEQK